MGLLTIYELQNDREPTNHLTKDTNRLYADCHINKQENWSETDGDIYGIKAIN